MTANKDHFLQCYINLIGYSLIFLMFFLEVELKPVHNMDTHNYDPVGRSDGFRHFLMEGTKSKVSILIVHCDYKINI